MTVFHTRVVRDRMVKTVRVDGDLVKLATDILRNHEEELERLHQGRQPYWLRPMDPDRIPLYTELLELESTVLRRVLD